MNSFKKITVMLIALMMLVFTAACGSQDTEKDSGSDSGKAQQEEQAAGDESEKQDENKEDADKSGQGSSLAVYFSRVGNSDFGDDIDADSSASIVADGDKVKGNAQLIAEAIADEAGCGTFEITVKDKYPADYDETVDQASDEQGDEARPELAGAPENWDKVKTVYLVFPNWWGDLPMPVYSFFDKYDFAGKTINVFATHEGSGFSGTVESIKTLEPEAEVVEALDIRGGDAEDSLDDIRAWVKDNI